MPYYKDYSDKKSQGEKRRSAQQRGGFDEEGSRYGGARPSRGGERTHDHAPHGATRSGRGKETRYDERTPREGYRQNGGSAGGEARSPRGYDRAPRHDDRPPREGDRHYSRRSREDTRSPRREGNFRFAPGGQQPYRERGSGTSPRPYDEQRRQRMDAAPSNGYNRFRYDAPERAPRPAYGTPVPPAEDSVENDNLLSGRNPIREALKSGRDIEKLMVTRGELSGSAREIVAMAKEQHVPVQEVDRARLDAITPHHQGMLAYASAYRYHTVEEMLALAKERGEDPFLVILDGITDPHNLGAIIRTAECAGAHGVIVQERRAVGLTPAAVKASAGAVEHIMVARVTNLVSILETLKKQNVWAYAADMAGEDYTAVDFSGGAAVVIGAEGEGVSRLVLETCDRRVALPVHGKIDSLNASVAAGVLLYAVLRSRKP